MARLARLAAAGETHLLVQRGHNGQVMFADRADHEAFLRMLRDASLTHRVAIHAYALAGAEVWLLATPAEANSLSLMMQSLGRHYVVAFNQRHGRSGTLWEGRFRATVIEASSFLSTVLAFVELAPVRAGLARDSHEYAWSSARHHLGLARDPLVSDHPLYWAIGNTPFEREVAHRQLLEQGLTPEQQRRIGDAAVKGWALGSEGFVAALEERTGRRARPGMRGRPRARKGPAED